MSSTTVPNLPAATSLNGTEEVPIVQNGTSYRATTSQIAGLVSGNVSYVNVLGGATGLNTSGGPITTAGTITLGGTLNIASGGTGQTTPSGAFSVLSPITSTGDLIIGNGVNSSTRLPIGLNGQILTSNGTTATWVTSGSVASYPPAGIPNSTSSSWGSSYSTTGTGSVLALATNPVFVTPTLGAATATSINGAAITSTTGGTLTLANNSTLATSGAFSQTHTVTAATNVTLPPGVSNNYLISSATQLSANPVTGTPSGSTYLRGDGTWSSITSVATATNLAGGAAGQVVYQSATGTTGFTAAGTTGQVLISGGTGSPTWTPGTLTLVSGSSLTTAGAFGLTLTSTATTNATLPAGTVTLAALSPSQTFTGTQSFTGTTSALAEILTNAAEVATVSATAATGTIAFYPSAQSVLYYTSNAAGNWTINITFSAGTTMNTAMTTGQSVTIAHLVTQGGSPTYNNVVQVDGTTTGVTTYWQGGAPTAGNASGVDVYTYTVIKRGSATFTVFASQTQFK
jgi:hypothetical protein